MIEKHEKKGFAGSRAGLTFIIGCLVLSGLLRFGIGGIALAKGVIQAEGPAKNAPARKVGTPKSCLFPPDTADLLNAIKTRNEQLDKREARLANRMQALRVAEQEIKKNTAAMTKAENRLAATLSIADTAAENDLQKLTSVYENMKPRNAAGLFAAMDPSFAAGFLGRMRPESAARILSSLQPKKAYAISLVLAGRNANAPKKVLP